MHDSILSEDLPSGKKIHTAAPWSSEAPSLREQLDSIGEHVRPWFTGQEFPLVLGGEHGILLPILENLHQHPSVRDISELTIVQIDAHADLREELNGERFSHGTVIRRALDLGVGRVIQIGVRAYSHEEEEAIQNEDRVEAWFARDLLSIVDGRLVWESLVERVSSISGPVWLLSLIHI